MKLSNADKNRMLARSLFIDASKSQIEIAQILQVGDKTISNYQSKDKAEGFDWLTLRAAKYIKESSETKENMYSLFVNYMYQSIKEIRENEKMSVEAKAQMLVSLGDSFSKMRKVAAAEDPEAYKYGLIKHTIETILLDIKDHIPTESMEKVIERVYAIQEELSDVSI
ncbi:MAG: hypothetical protein C0625_02065 [Arcobacter sp.]|nr:MAG: hypothetical protein C0625_02065 [Arcobacter sp.]